MVTRSIHGWRGLRLVALAAVFLLECRHEPLRYEFARASAGAAGASGDQHGEGGTSAGGDSGAKGGAAGEELRGGEGGAEPPIAGGAGGDATGGRHAGGDAGRGGGSAGGAGSGGAAGGGSGASGGEAGVPAAGGGAPGGDAGAPGGEAGAPPNATEEPVIVPHCHSGGLIFAPIAFFAPSAIAVMVARTPGAGRASIYAASEASDAMAVIWQLTADDDTSWVPWHCFDALPAPIRVSADVLPNGHPETFATTRAGGLFVRRMHTGTADYWTEWQALGVPYAASLVSDVGTTAGVRSTHLYVVDRGSIYFRYHLDEFGDDSYAPYSGWRKIEGSGAVAVDAVELPDGSQRVFRSTGSGVETSRQVSNAVGAEFDAWSVTETEFVAADLEAARTDSGVDLFALADGRVWHAPVGEQTIGGFTRLGETGISPRFVSIAARSRMADRSVVYGLGDDGIVYSFESAQGWQAIGGQ